MCSIIGLRNTSSSQRRLFASGIESNASLINAYLIDGPMIFVHPVRRGIFGLPVMDYGCKPTDNGNLILSPDEMSMILQDCKSSGKFFRKLLGSEEVINGKERYCLWIRPEDVEEAQSIPEICRRIQAVREFRLKSTKIPTRNKAEIPYSFDEIRGDPKSHSILIPIHSSENREFLPVDRRGADVIASNACLSLCDAPDWCISLIASRLHLIWIGTVCGRLETRFRYSNTLGWNTFPVPKFTEDQLAALTKSAMAILRCRLTHHPKTIADLYDPDKMPDDLRAAHKANDDLLEGMYIGRPFRNDTERLEHLFKLYAARVKKLKKGAA